MAKIGYARVSKDEQNPDRQIDILAEAGCDRVFVDHASGKLDARPELAKALDYLRPGDHLVVGSLDRLGRSVPHLTGLTRDLAEKGMHLVVLNLGIDTSTITGKLFVTILAGIAEFERDLLIQRTNEGLAAARARGRKGGRKPKLTDIQVEQARRMYAERQHTIKQIADTFRVSPATIYRHLDPDAVQAASDR